ncbi:TetR/AcrR family transcriptional regulator [Stenotrophomonas tumulicola]|uniref:TetR/AcrR family transcriptional regulator n=1 Tax=Stenotrophomonas tumulicola TaxID=1685415 RepID=A0A7W3IGH7_9GAMM|nr:TetR/AcrR family transcriptional regulator [Stenotrophomonas tumulicola]MBA8680993.1 TetR/AcrR family transcriptional regulator [Stenotrophomonas tumulicola]
MTSSLPPEAKNTHRERILSAAEDLITTQGIEAATTRAVAAAAGVQPPILYRLFGGKDGLLDAVAERALQAYVGSKARREATTDPLQELREGWDLHIEFGLTRPAIFLVMVLRSTRARETPAMRQGTEFLRDKVRRLASMGRLRVTEARTLELLQAGATGTILTLLRQPSEVRDQGLSHAVREAVLATVVGAATEDIDSGERTAAVMLRARLPQVGAISDGERLLLAELLDRIAG